MKVGELLKHTEARLAVPEQFSEDPRQEARELLAYAMQKLPAELSKHQDEPVDQHVHNEFMRLLSRRLNAEPTGYIVGAVEIMGLRFKVDRRGFIPRLDLPVLINAALEQTPQDVHGHALDLACGIGAAGICLAHHRPGLRVDLADVSAEAMELARENADVLVPGRAHCWAGDLFQPLPKKRKYVVVMANPPWVPDGTPLPDEVMNEPHVSFFGGPDGLDIVRRLVRELPEWLAPNGVYAQECDPSQVQAVLGLLRDAGLRDAKAHADPQGVERVVSARK